MKASHSCLCIALCLAVTAVTSLGATFYVDPVNGSMAGDGSAANPWSTLAEVVSANKIETRRPAAYPYLYGDPLVGFNVGAPVQPGDTIELLSGDHGDVYIQANFNSDWITIKAADGHTPIVRRFQFRGGCKWHIDGVTVSQEPYGTPGTITAVNFENHGWHGPCYDCIIENSHIYGVDDTSAFTDTDWLSLTPGAGVGSGGPRNIIRNNTIRNVQLAVNVGGDDSLIEYNTLVGIAHDGFRSAGDRIIWQYNTMSDFVDVDGNHDDMIQMYRGGGVPHVGVEIRGNYFDGRKIAGRPHTTSPQGIGCFDGPYVDCIVENNIVLTAHYHGLSLYGADNCVIVNNTVLDPSRQYPAWIVTPGGSTDCVIRNNMTYSLQSPDANAGIVVDHNILLTDALSDQIFVDWRNGDVHLLAAGPAVDAGSADLAPTVDIDGVTRPQGSAWDIGAYEYASGPANQAPVADAGADQSINDADDSGAENITLDGTGSSDSDGTIAGYVWSENASQIATGVSPTVSVAVGVHTIDLTVTDDDSATDSDSVTITVSAYVNLAPMADAGADQTVDDADDSGAENVTLDGLGSSDSDGTIAGYVWSENASQIATGVSPTVSVAVGVHTIDLTVTDDDSATDSDSVTVTVNEYVNIAPTADAGTDQTLEDADDNGAENVTLDGSGSSDSDGAIVSYVWLEDASLIAAGVSSSVSFAVGAHTVELTVTDDDSATDSDSVVVTVNPHVNVSPTADAGADQTVMDSDEDGSQNVTLDAAGSSDSDGTIVSYVWQENASQIATGVSPSVSFAIGKHTVALIVTDDDSATDNDSVVITVEEWSATSSRTWQNFAIDAQTGAFTFEFDAVANNADMDGVTGVSNGAATTWNDVACIVRFAPAGVIDVRNGGSYTADATINYVAGTTYHVRMEIDIPAHTYSVYVTPSGQSEIALATDYAFRLQQAGVTTLNNWTLNATNTDESHTIRNVVVTEVVNQAPMADAGSDQTIGDNDDSGAEPVALDGSGSSDADGAVVSYIWAENASQIATGVSPTASFAVGAHTVHLTVTDDDSATDSDSVTITVTPYVNVAPVADAGADQTVTDDDGDGTASATLDGSGSSDSDGTIVSYVWEEDAAQIATGLSPAVTLAVGVHTVDLTVTDDDSDTSGDSVVVTVVSRTLVSSTDAYTWTVSTLPAQTGVFTAEFDATPSAAGMDGVTGLSSGPGDWWNELACIVRFSTANVIDVRNGGAYAADASVTYTAGVSYHFRLVIDVPNHTYSVYVTPDGQSEVTLASGYAFRTEQANITSIDHWTLNAAFSVGTHTVSSLTITD